MSEDKTKAGSDVGPTRLVTVRVFFKRIVKPFDTVVEDTSLPSPSPPPTEVPRVGAPCTTPHKRGRHVGSGVPRPLAHTLTTCVGRTRSRRLKGPRTDGFTPMILGL